MTSTAAERIAIVGTGLIGTSIAMASARVGCDVSGWDLDPWRPCARAPTGGFGVAASLEDAVAGADDRGGCRAHSATARWSPRPSLPLPKQW